MTQDRPNGTDWHAFDDRESGLFVHNSSGLLLQLNRCDLAILDEGVVWVLSEDLQISPTDFVRTSVVDAVWPQRFILTSDATDLHEILETAISSGYVERFFKDQGKLRYAPNFNPAV